MFDRFVLQINFHEFWAYLWEMPRLISSWLDLTTHLPESVKTLCPCACRSHAVCVLSLMCFTFPKGIYLTLGTSHLRVYLKKRWAYGILSQHDNGTSWRFLLFSTNHMERQKRETVMRFLDLWGMDTWEKIIWSSVFILVLVVLKLQPLKCWPL